MSTAQSGVKLDLEINEIVKWNIGVNPLFSQLGLQILKQALHTEAKLFKKQHTIVTPVGDKRQPRGAYLQQFSVIT